MNVALIGFGVENQAAQRYFAKRGVSLTVCDQNPSLELPEGVASNLGDNYLENLDKFDVIVRTSGMHPSVILDRNPSVASKITTAINIFFEECNTPIIGVTGTKGKGTTSSLIQEILVSASRKSVLAGNIGIPALDVLTEANQSEYVVLELSSFQLYDLKHSPKYAVCLMVVPEHLNWHRDFDDYIRSKSNMFRFQKGDDVAIFNALNKSSAGVANTSPAETKLKYAVPSNNEDTYGCTTYVKNDRVYYNGQEIMSVSDVKLLGKHNLENVCAAITATWNLIDGNIEAIQQAVSSFSGLPYRLELVRELNGVKYYNDSFSTTPETAIAALQSFEQPIVAILGGSDKGVVFNELAKEIVKNNVKQVLAIGETGRVIATLLQNEGFSNITTEGLETMDDIVTTAERRAEPGDIVLLSTGAASFGMFRDYKDRGDQYNDSVNKLA